ncbi:MAG: glycerol-3-phosphate cytidylyltransferase [Candidatus Cloacimonadota bacterium]|nr:MAG: glycerol-3-phosphate cytidylyltransferase [Candidatus Cloacimonadota bacterium]PIE81097.1 MAG: glycerol-3-phosphate cytidylyltransferase [Candidatus Delongbacteria bacterium]
MKKVITYGTFDLFHIGHLNILRRAKELGDYLIVAVSTDQFNAIKGKKCTYPYEHRSEIVKAIRYVDEVIPENDWEQKREDIEKHEISTFVMGDDWKGKFDFLKDKCEVVYLNRTKSISTTEIKEEIRGTKS